VSRGPSLSFRRMGPKKTPAAEPSLRQQLLEARAKVEHQRLIMQAGPALIPMTDGGGPGMNSAFAQSEAELRQTLAELDESLAGLGRGDG